MDLFGKRKGWGGRKIRLTARRCAMAVIVSLCGGTAIEAQSPTAADIAPLMVPGWNLGNTMEAPTYDGNDLNSETSWQPTKTTQKVIDYVKSAGFRSVRIPCSWFIHMDDDYEINALWMRRVKQVVDYCIKDSLYVMLNDHYDEGWIERSFEDLSEENVQKNCSILASMWRQIATTFRDYDHHLLFAGMNEPGANDAAKVEVLKRYHQTFVDVVRATGGNNTNRVLVVQAPNTDINLSTEYNILPSDPTPNAMMLEAHFYSPYRFIMMAEDADWGKVAYYWGRNNHVEGSLRNSSSDEEESYVGQQMRKMWVNYGNKGVPVIIGEYGGTWRYVGEGEDQDKHNQSIYDWYKATTRYAVSYGCVPMVWDTNYCNRPSGTVIDRTNCSIFNQFAYDGIMDGVANAKWPVATDIKDIAYDNSDEGEGQAYNIMGIPVDDSYRGLVIVNGKKFIRK